MSAASWTGTAARLGAADEEAGGGEPDGGTDGGGVAEGADAPPPQATTDAIIKAKDANVARDIGRVSWVRMSMPDPRCRIAADEMGDSRPR
jgi:hypothetical protein